MTRERPRVAVVMGGPSDEHEVSLNSGRQVLAALEGEESVTVVVGRDRSWTVDGVPQRTIGAAIDAILSRADVAFLALHGPFGEDGVVQGFFETCGLAYTGSGVLASALAMDKLHAKRVFEAHGLPTAPWVAFERGSSRAGRATLYDRVEHELGFPCVIKPAGLGSSVGVSFPRDRTELERRVEDLATSGHDVLVELEIKGRELTCGVLECARETRTFALPVTEIVPNARYAFFDYEAKYTPGATAEITPAELPVALSERIRSLALVTHERFGCRDMSRTDFMLDANGNPFILEINTIPGLTGTSLLPQQAEAHGIAFAELVRILVDNAWLRSNARVSTP